MFTRALIRWVGLALVIGVAAAIVPGVDVHGGFVTLLWLAVLFSAVNLILGTLARVVSLPLIVVSLGLFLWVINAAMLALTAGLSSRLDIDDFGSAMLASLVISVFSWAAELVAPILEKRHAAHHPSRASSA
jgi:putative membrane protein